MHLRSRLWIVAFLTIAAIMTSHADDTMVTPEKGLKSLAETVGDAVKVEGLLTFYRTPDKLFLALDQQLLGQDLGFAATRIKAAGDFAGRDSNLSQNEIVKWRLIGSDLILEKQNLDFRSDASSSMYHAVRGTFPHSPVFSARRIPIKEESIILIDATELFGPNLAAMMPPKSSWNPDGPPSLDQIRSFPENSFARLMFRFKGGEGDEQPTGFARFASPNRLADSRFMEMMVDFNFFRLPDNGFRPRRADKRIGGFPLTFKDYSDVEAEDTAMRHLYTRWDLRKKDPNAALSEPVNPIVFYIDRSVPEKWRPLMHQAGNWWNVSFEKIGLLNAVQIKDQPDDPNFDPNNINHSMIYWNLTDDLVFSGLAGPSIIDPRNGQVLKANVYINGEFPSFALHRYLVYSWWRAPDPGMDSLDWFSENQKFRQQSLNGQSCNRQASFSSQLAFARLVLRARGQLAGSPEEAERFAREAFLELVAHEIGHALGFPHNWKASLVSSWDDVRDGKVTGRTDSNIFSSSVMDYNPIYLAPKGQAQGDFFMQEVGAFDDLFVAYLYQPLDQVSPEEEARQLDIIAARAETRNGLVYDGGELNNIDPTSNSDDFGDDPLAFAEARLLMLQQEVLPVLPKLVLEEGHDYNLLRQALDSAIFSVAMDYIDMTSRFVGGQVLLRRSATSAAATSGGPAPITPIAPDKQRKALQILDQRLFASNLFHLPKEALSQMESDLLYDWNYPWRYVSDYNIDARIAGLYQAALSTLLAPDRLARVLDNEKRFSEANPFTLLELMAHLSQTAFGKSQPPGGLTTDQRALQRLLVKAWLNLATQPASGTPAEASQIAAWQAARLADRIQPEKYSGYDQPHYMDLKNRIRNSLSLQEE